jgi:flagellar FliL protein
MASALSALSKRKTLIIIVVVVLIALLVGGFFVVRMLQHQQATALGLDATAADEAPAKPAAPRRPAGQAPYFLPLEMFTANLQDKDRERFGQIGVTLEIAGKEAEPIIKSYIPILRSRILALLSSKSSHELLTLEGKNALATEILTMARTEVGRENSGKIYAVLFSNFVVQ